MDRDALCLRVPGEVYSGINKIPANTAADKVRKQSKVGQLDLFISLISLKLTKTGRFSVHLQQVIFSTVAREHVT